MALTLNVGNISVLLIFLTFFSRCTEIKLWRVRQIIFFCNAILLATYLIVAGRKSLRNSGILPISVEDGC